MKLYQLIRPQREPDLLSSFNLQVKKARIFTALPPVAHEAVAALIA